VARSGFSYPLLAPVAAAAASSSPKTPRLRILTRIRQVQRERKKGRFEWIICGGFKIHCSAERREVYILPVVPCGKSALPLVGKCFCTVQEKKREDNGIQRDGSYPSHSFVKRLERKQMGP
jgi:hypothetical protein